MDSEAKISIEFTESERHFIASTVCTEVFGGGSTHAIESILGSWTEALRLLGPEMDLQFQSGVSEITLSPDQWQTVYHAIHAVIYGLGPFELSLCTGVYLAEACNINLQICGAVWGVYTGAQWGKDYSCCR